MCMSQARTEKRKSESNKVTGLICSKLRHLKMHIFCLQAGRGQYWEVKYNKKNLSDAGEYLKQKIVTP